MEYEKIKQLMEDMGASKLSEVSIDFPDGTKISMKKEEKQVVKITESENVLTVKEKYQKEEQIAEIEANESRNIIKAPMVGTFYAKPSPDSQPFVKIGQKVKKGEVLCIIEAMKLMNEIESEFDGEIEEILIQDGECVEYGKPLFIIK